MTPYLAAVALYAGTYWLASRGIDGAWFAAARAVRMVRGAEQ